ncbi:glycine cleavage system aminomethyltransferase GcvT [Candidatus Woesearchaeota archaeon]|nr:glycine cleavage system aminomethyltransferase GcvT [Candidatus Woesearchaeota archaeon]
MTTAKLLATPLHDWHKDHGGKMVPFAGWDMPVQYPTGIFGEHAAVRSSAGIFDVSHMGRFHITGRNSLGLLQYYLANDASRLKPGQAQYSFLLKQGEGKKPLTLDDVYLYMIAENDYILIVNAANATADLEHLTANAQEYGVGIQDITTETCLIAVQGPKSKIVLEQIVGPISIEGANRFAQLNDVIVAATGYTGEFTRYEVIVRSEKAPGFWESLVSAGATPAGLGARNTLRIEAGLLLFGHDITLEVSPVEAGVQCGVGIQDFVKPGKKHAMLGKDFYAAQMEAQKEGTIGRYTVLLELPQPRQIEPKEGGQTSKLIRDGKVIGEVTSSTVAPMVRYEGNQMVKEEPAKMRRRGIAMGYSTGPLKPGTSISVQVRGEGTPIEAMVMNALIDKKNPVMVAGLAHVRPVTHFYN